MKLKPLVLVVSYLISLSLSAQELRYERDSSGNRVSRALVTESVALPMARSNGQSFVGANRSVLSQPQELRNLNPSNIQYDWTLDTTADVGEIPMSASVLPNGMALVQVPLITGSADAQCPSLALTYASYSGRGDAGYGWSLSGLSSISIANKNQYYHGTSEGAVVGAEGSVYALDGQPLLANDLTLQSSYSLRVADGQILVEPHRDASGQVQYFTAAYPDGSTALFGYENNTQPRKDYPLTRATSRFGEVTTYTYSFANNEYRIVGMSHAGGSVAFSYVIDALAPSGYKAGLASKRGYLLKTITVHNKTGQRLAQYSLTHESLYGVNLLKKIELSTLNGHHLNPLTFKYNVEDVHSTPPARLDTAAALSRYFSDSTHSVSYATAKFLHESYADGLVHYPVYDTYKRTSLNHYGSGYPSDHKILVNRDVDLQLYSESLVLVSGEKFQFCQPADINADGIDEIVKVNYGAASTTRTNFNICVYGYGSDGTLSRLDSLSTYISAVKSSFSVKSPIQCHYDLRDFLGRGYAQLLIIPYYKDVYGGTCNAGSVIVDFVTGQKYWESQMSIPLIGTADVAMDFFCSDIDSDGKAEAVMTVAGYIYVYKHSEETYTFVLQNESRGPRYDVQYPGKRYLADLNGDGYLDIIVSTHPHIQLDTLRYYIYTGIGYADVVSENVCMLSSDDQVIFQDVDDDGLPDMVILSEDTLTTRINNNGSFADADIYTCTVPQRAGYDHAHAIIPCSPSGWDYKYRLMIKNNGRMYSYYFPKQVSAGRMLEYAIGSYGVGDAFGYRDLREYSAWDYSETGRSLRDGYYSRTIGISPVVLHLKVHPEGNQKRYTNKTEYRYKDAVLNSQSLGFCGFGTVEKHNQTLGVSIRNEYAPDRRSVLLSSQSYLLHDNTRKLSTQTNTYLDVPTSYGRTRPRARTQYSRNYLDDTYAYVDSIRYDATFDLPTYTRTKSGHTAATSIAHRTGRTVLTSHTYRNVLTPECYIVGLPQGETTNTTSDILSGTIIDICSYSYDANNLPKLLTRMRGDGSGQPTQYQRDSLYYDTHGNVIRRASAQYGSAVYNAESYTYDSVRHSRLLSSTDAMGHTTTYSDFDNWGCPRQSTDWRGRTSSVQYDAWGNAIGSTAIDGTTSATVSAWGGDDLYTVTSSGSGAPISIAHYNDLGQNTLSEQQRFDGSMLKVRKRYDNLGRISAESLPFKDELLDEPAYTTYTYDEYSRPTSVASPGGRGRVWTYDDAYTTTVTEDGISRTTAINPYTLHQTSTDGALTAEITPAIDGQTALAVVYPAGSPERELSRTEYGYDKYGRLIRKKNTYTGEKTYSYTNLSDGGMSVTESNPNGSIITDVDRYGRTTSVVRSGEGAFTSAYSYNALGQLTGVSNTAEGASTAYNSVSYTYDAYDRPASVTVNNGSNRYFTRQYSYNSNGQLSSIRYTSQNGDLGVEGRTYANGHLKSYKYWFHDDPLVVAKNIWTLQEENSHGQPTRATSGRLTREYGYISTTMLPSSRKIRLTSSSSTSGPFIGFEVYQFNASNGNLTEKAWPGTHRFQQYSYDALNRLRSDSTGMYAYNDAGDPSASIRNGTLQYGSVSRVHGETGVINPSDTVTTRTASQTLLYAAYGRPTRLEVENPDLAGDIQAATFRYNQNLERCSVSNQHVTPAPPFELPEVKYYAGGCYEGYTLGIRNINKEVVYLGGSYYSAPAAVVIQNGTKTLYFIGRDYQGSITHLIAEDGTVVEQTEYDSWGLPRRTLSDGTTLDAYRGDDVPLLLGRGYTGHEHLQWAGLINMNARLYDPFTGRFLSPDPVLQDPLNPQTYNPYNYCLNNPLKYTDESGEFLTWQFGMSSFSIGVNFSPIGVPLGFGLTFGLDGADVGIYGEVGYRIANYGVSAICTYSFANQTTSFSLNASYSFAPFYASASLGYSNGDWSWGVSLGVGDGDGISGANCSIGYGSSGLFWEIGGYYDYSNAYAFSKGCKEIGINKEDALDPTDEVLIKCQQEWYPDAPMDNIVAFSVENVPEKYFNLMEMNDANATTVPQYRNGKVSGNSSVYFRKTAFASTRTLYTTMGHEFVHVSNYITASRLGYTRNDVKNANFFEMTEYWAYSFENLYKPTYNSFDTSAIIAFYGLDVFSSFSFINMGWFATRKNVL